RIVLSNDGHKIYSTTESPLYKGFKSLKNDSFPQFENTNPWIFLYQEIIDHFDGKSNRIKGSLSANQRILKLINLLYS
ncbi:MAG TPA: gfo/Idh/MocA family oxidoreductase, partial [Leptospiraceae bacterium]|nr:gfo/Idh/MocA family oxidoreductase [Leptospiraceae bacterium]